jgi:hypothetical protein
VAPGHVRASDADRERVVDELKTAFVQGRLTRDELGVRLGQALTSRTYADLTKVIVAIRSAPPAPRPRPSLPVLPPRKPIKIRPRRRVPRKAVAAGAAAVLLPGAAAAFLTSWGEFFVLLVLAFTAMVVTGGPSAPCHPVPAAARTRVRRG